MLLIYAKHITPKVSYVVKLMLEEIAGFEIRITDNMQEYVEHNSGSINYSDTTLKPNELLYRPNGLLFHSSITALQASISANNEEYFLYLEGENIKGNLFDPFAAAFYLVTRYEEYFPYNRDQFDRFEAASSVMYREGVLEIPLVNHWALKLQKQISASFPGLKFRRLKFSQIVTIDIDQAYAFKYRGIKRNAVSFVKNIVQRKTQLLKMQLGSLFQKERDPYDTYQYLQLVQEENNIPFIYFVNIGNYSKYDKNLSTKNAAFQELLRKIKSYAPVGLHPSYYSNDVVSKFASEKEQLEKLLDNPVKKSRQHYLKLFFPVTYRNLIKIGIEEDYTMGFASSPGFRAGICTPFSWFDLEKNCVTGLKIFPTTFMDGTLIEDLALSPEEAEEKIFSLRKTVEKYSGCYISIWHNHTVSNQLLWKGWKKVFENSIK